MVVTIVVAQTAVSYMVWLWGMVLLLIGYLLHRASKKVSNTTITAASMLLGYVLYRALGAEIRHWLEGTEDLAIILSRLSLIAFILPLAVATWFSGNDRPQLLTGGHWKRTIYFPWIVAGFREDPIWRFMLIFAAVSTAIFTFVIDWRREDLPMLAVYALLFAVINSVLEELLWRGYILSRVVKDYGVIHGLVIAGAAFGFYHLHLGFPWGICLLFSLFGMMMGAVAIRSGGLGPVTVLHFVMNLWFVMSGMII